MSPARISHSELLSSWKEHDKQRKLVQRQVQQYHKAKTRFRGDHEKSSTTWTKEKPATISLTHMSKIIEFRADDAGWSVIVQPSVSMEQLVDACLVRDVICPVVIECRDMSIGGAFCGTATGSSSFRQGLFDSVVKSIQFIHGDGVQCDWIEEDGCLKDIANSYGTLGLVVCLQLRLQLVPKEAVVRLDYTQVLSVQEACNRLERAKDGEGDAAFIEAIVFEKQCLVIRGVLRTKVTGSPTITFLSRKDPLFFLHIQSKLDNQEDVIDSDTVPLKDYLFRWDRGVWRARTYAHRYVCTPFHRITRWPLDSAVRTSRALKAFQAAGLFATYVVKDIGVPPEKATELVAWLHKHWGTGPVLMWLVNVERRPSYVNIESDFLMNIGVYGPLPKDAPSMTAFCQELEKKHLECGGIEPGHSIKYSPSWKWEHLWNSYAYEERRRQFHAGSLPSIANKMRDAGRVGKTAAAPRPLPGIQRITSLVLSELHGVLSRAKTV